MLTELQDMWPAVAFRIAGVQREEGLRNILSVGAANFQAVTPRMSEALGLVPGPPLASAVT